MVIASHVCLFLALDAAEKEQLSTEQIVKNKNDKWVVLMAALRWWLNVKANIKPISSDTHQLHAMPLHHFTI